MRGRLATSLLSVFCAASCAKPVTPPAPIPAKVAPGPPARDVGPLVALGYIEDRVGSHDSQVVPDGDVDFALRVRISGDVRALVLYGSDPTGVPHGGEVWDTMTAPDKFPEAWHMLALAQDSWALAVFDSKNALLNPHVVLDRKSFDNETVTIFVSDPGRGRFVSGRTYTLLVVRNDGKTDRATTTVL
jgi:hypothetical protein